MSDLQARSILIVEDDTALNRLLADQVRRQGHLPLTAHSIAEANTCIQAASPVLVLLDMRLPDSPGLDAIALFRDICPVIVLTAYGSVEQAVKAVQAGATDYLIKPVSAARLDLAITRALETASLRRKVEFLESKAANSTGRQIVGRSEAIRHVQQLIGLVANADTTVLIQGESGVGKELVAESIHDQSARRSQQLVTIDCATLQENLLESELFGHERGAFTGADRRKDGLIEVADGGTVFLDEIGEIGGSIQAKLLRVLETSRFRRLGGTRDISVNVRFITATNRDLKTLADQSSFRSDLYYRLSPFSITVPPLRERKMDIIPLARHFLEGRSFLRSVPKNFHSSSERALEAYHWPGNIRELRNAVERGLLMSADSPVILPQHLALPSSNGGSTDFILSFPHQPTLEEVKQTYIDRMLHAYSGNRHQAALAMGISERTLFRHAKESNESR